MDAALQAYGDAKLAHLSANGRLVRAYDAGRIAASALVRAHGLRVRAANHHEITVGTAALLGSDALRRALRAFEAFRTLRSEIEYGWETRASEGDAEKALAVVREILAHGALDLRRHRPEISPRIESPS